MAIRFHYLLAISFYSPATLINNRGVDRVDKLDPDPSTDISDIIQKEITVEPADRADDGNEVGEATYTVTVCGRKTGINPLTHRPILTHIPRAFARHAVTTAFDGMYTLELDKEALVFPPCPDFFLFDLMALRPLFFEGLPNLAIHGTERLHWHSIIICPQAFLGFARIEAHYFYTDHPEVYVLHCAIHRPDGAFVQYIRIHVETRTQYLVVADLARLKAQDPSLHIA
ncbi:hypothetical protein FISHEDRAFT_61605 [Fistulina hepatica ATCC 64428]|uniref:Uncharacterized protein n=1 Tax=Fistulina hepatica ATCC 64428 TaxID=1128425 RepID=A0A0D7A4V1_9AGAR|nr:hypothetical protein FISHEDRAFT_61605 [Fistulina hepatica ATCC 64428]